MRITINECLRPIFFIRNVTGTTAVAVPMTMQAMGSVESFSIGASRVPISPPAKTTKEETAIIRDCAMVRSHTLRGRAINLLLLMFNGLFLFGFEQGSS